MAPLRFAAQRAIELLLGAWLASMVGCAGPAALAAMQTAGPLALSATEHVVAAGGNAKSKDDDESIKDGQDDDAALKCQQLVRHPAGVEEIQRTPDLNIVSREMRVQRIGENYRWEVYRSHGSSPEGWRRQSRLDGLHFDPPLQYLLPDKKPRYLAYAISTPETPEDSEQMMTLVDDFGSKVGTFEWHGVHYTYTLLKHLPCFPEPGEK